MESISRRTLVAGGCFLVAGPSLARALKAMRFDFEDEVPDLIFPPDQPADWPAWRDKLKKWRTSQQSALVGTTYDDPKKQWTQSCYCAHKIMTWDRSFLDPERGHYKVEEYLAEGKRIFGGFDAVVLWQAYPRIGFDRRNQFDYYRGLPGGLPGLADAIRRFHRAGVHVFIDYNPWDIGTEREPLNDEHAIARLCEEIGADGVFLDTMTTGASAMRKALDEKSPAVVFETELPLPLEGVPHNSLSWAQWLDKSPVPGVLRDHWVERRHMMHAIRRWDTDHTNEIHMAWMNGTGVLVWENVFGSWNPWSNENCRLLRQILPVQRHFSELFLHGDWEPLVASDSNCAYASGWKSDDLILWTAVNSGSQASKDGWCQLDHLAGWRLFDLVRGLEISSASSVPPGGVGGFAAMPASKVDATFLHFLARQRSEFLHPVEVNRSRTIRPISALAVKPILKAHLDMAKVPGGNYTIKSAFRKRECGERGYATYANQVYPELHEPLVEEFKVQVGDFAISKDEVSNAEFQTFLKATGYRPKVPQSFLANWPKDGVPDPNSPVTFVSIEDAEAFAKWQGGRLPTDQEWQIAMETLKLDRRQPDVWNWTSSRFTDGQTQFVLLKGGAVFEAKGSIWYADGGIKGTEFTAKFIEIWPGLDRCETIGFRYIIDLT